MIAPSDRPTSSPDVAFSRSLAVDDLPSDGLEMTIEANPAECGSIARELDLPQVISLVAHYRLMPRSGGRLQVEGELTARIVQVCVVSLEPFESAITQPIELTFAPAPKPVAEPPRQPARRARRRAPIEVVEPPPPIHAADETEPPDPIIDGRVDLGAVAAEFLALALDFYPKKPGVQFADVVIGASDGPEPSAFAALGRLKDRS